MSSDTEVQFEGDHHNGSTVPNGSLSNSHLNGYHNSSTIPSKASNGYTHLSQDDIDTKPTDGPTYTTTQGSHLSSPKHRGYTPMAQDEYVHAAVSYSPVDEHAEVHIQKRQEGPPKDIWMLVYIIFAIHGIGTLLPWNCFITAEAYFTEYKFGNVSDDVEYKDKFVSYVGIGGFVPSVVFLAIALFFPPKSNKMITFIGLFIMMLLFILTTILAIVDSSEWPASFFAITMATNVIFNSGCAVYQSGMFGLAAYLPDAYTQSYIVGQGIGGTFVALLSIFSLAVAGDLQKAAVAFFLCAVLVLIVCVCTYALLFKMKFMKYYMNVVHEVVSDKEVEASGGYKSPPLFKIFKAIWPQIFNIWLTFTITLSIFPGSLVHVQPFNSGSAFFDAYFTSVTCFLFFNLFDFFGSVIPAKIKWPSRKRTWVIVIGRLVFIPLILFCNYRPETRVAPVLISNDYLYILIVICMALSNGYLKTIIIIDGQTELPNPAWASKAASMMVFFLVVGIFCGVQLSVFLPYIVGK